MYFKFEDVLNDWSDGDFCMVNNILKVKTVDGKVSHLWVDGDSEGEVWWQGTVLSVTDTDVVIEYGDEDDTKILC